MSTRHRRDSEAPRPGTTSGIGGFFSDISKGAQAALYNAKIVSCLFINYKLLHRCETWEVNVCVNIYVFKHLCIYHVCTHVLLYMCVCAYATTSTPRLLVCLYVCDVNVFAVRMLKFLCFRNVRRDMSFFLSNLPYCVA